MARKKTTKREVGQVIWWLGAGATILGLFVAIKNNWAALQR